MSRNFLFVLILLIGCLTQFAADIYAPALPTIGHELNSPLNLVQWSMAIYMLGVAISQLFYGIISEGVGRKAPLLVGLCIMFIGTIICIFATNITLLILGRLIQGIGAGACASMWRIIFRDIYSGDDLAKYGSYLAASITFIIPAAPALGAYLQYYFSWRATFIFLALYTVFLLFCAIYGYRETSQHHHPERLKRSFIQSTLRELLTNHTFMGISLAVFMTYGGFFAWMTAAPVLLIHLAGMNSVHFGWFLFFGVGGVYAFAGFLNGRLVPRFGIKNMIRLGWIITSLSGLLLLMGYFLWGISSWDIAPMMLLYYAGAMFVFPNTNAIALTPFGKIAGYAGALYGVLQTGGAAILGGVVSHLPESNQISLSILILASSAIAWVCFEFTRAPP